VGQLAFDQGQDQRALVLEVAVHQPLADLGRCRDLADRSRVETTADEAALCGVQDLPALGFGVGGGGVFGRGERGVCLRHCMIRKLPMP